MIRPMKADDINNILSVEKKAWGKAAASREQIQQRFLVFPEGSVVIENNDGKLIGYAATQLVDHISTKPWGVQTDNGYITSTYQPNGQIVYGVSMSALPEAAPYKICAHVVEYFYRVFIHSGRCSAICLGSRLPGFRKWHKNNQTDIKAYLSHTHKGLSRDSELRLYQQNGFELLWEIPNYFVDDQSLNYGAMIIRR